MQDYSIGFTSLVPAHIGSTYPVPTHIVSVGVALALRRYRLLMSIKYVLTTHVDDCNVRGGANVFPKLLSLLVV